LRPEFQLDVSSDIFDLFFNGVSGYRSQYLSDPDEGQKQNSHLLLRISDKLLVYSNGKHTKHSMSEFSLLQALRCSSAKIWIRENVDKFDHELIEDIAVPVWHTEAVAAIQAYREHHRPDPPAQEKAICGIRAPLVKAGDQGRVS